MLIRLSLRNTGMTFCKRIICSVVLLSSISIPQHVLARSIKVASLVEFQKAIHDAVAGDVIILKDGVYTTTEDIEISKNGTVTAPITIAAETIGGAEIAGAGGFNIISPSSYLIIRGFKFTHNASKAKTSPGTSFCRWTHNIFQTTGNGEYLTLAGSDHQADYNTFQNKNSMGRFIAVRGFENQIAQRLWIHHNYFFNFPYQGGSNGAEPFQFGLSGLSLSSSNSIVEYNLFEECYGENEMISVKASDVILRYNTIRNCPAQFTLRHGNRCFVYGNYFINTPGIRIFGDDHIIHSNYFEGCSLAINVGNGGAEVADGAPLTSHDRPDNVLIAFNTMVNNQRNIVQTARPNGLGATSVKVIYNVIQGGGPAAEITGPYINALWKGNMIFGTQGFGSLPTSECETKDPKLEKDASGIFHLQKGSAAIDVVTESFSEITTDFDGQPRITAFDIGADEFSKAKVEAHVLGKDEVGHLVKIH